MDQRNMPDLWRSNSIIYRYGQMHLAHGLEEIGIGRGASQAIPIIMRFPGITQDVLAGILTLDKGTIARTLRQLEEDGYISRSPDESDARANRVYPTEKLRGHAPLVGSIMEQWYDIVFEGIDEKERKIVLSGLEKMANNAKKHISRIK